MSSNVEIIVGTYEEFLLGYKTEIRNEKETLVQSFADKSHSGSLKCLAVYQHWIATGATDDRIFIYDMRTRKQSQIILSHEGTINALAFTPDSTHLLSGADDGHMVATRLNTWCTEANWKKAHNGSAVTHISCHPSGKLALSLGADIVLRTWNLVKGRVAYKTNLKSRNTLGTQPDCLAWSLSGDYFTLGGQRVVEIWSIKSADVVRSQQCASKPVCVCWISNDVCLVGLEDGKIMWITVKEQEEEKIPLIEAHPARVKAMAYLNGTLVTASSSGELTLWTVNESRKNLKRIATTNLGCRPTCVGLLDLSQFGPEYLSNKVVEEKDIKVHKLEKKRTQQERGVVTIEYEDKDDAQMVGLSQSSKKKKSTSSDENDENQLEENEDSESDEINDDSSENGGEEETSESEPSSDAENEPTVSKRPVLKRKQKSTKEQKPNNKQPKLNENKRIPPNKKLNTKKKRKQ